jgi:hypothetical protein
MPVVAVVDITETTLGAPFIEPAPDLPVTVAKVVVVTERSQQATKPLRQ